MTEPDIPRPSPALLAAGRWTLDPQRSEVSTRTRAMFGLFAVTGRFRLKSGEVVVASEPADCSVTAIIDAASFESGNARRDRDVTSAALLDATAHRDITFTSSAVRPDGEGWLVTGDLAVHGAVQPLELRVRSVRDEGGIARFSASARLDRRRFGVTGKSAMVANIVSIVIDAVGLRG